MVLRIVCFAGSRNSSTSKSCFVLCQEASCVLTRQLKVVPTAKLLAILQLLLEASALAPSVLLPLLLLHTLTTPSDVPTTSCKGLQVSE